MRIHLLIFILLALLVIFSHYLLNSIYLDYGMHSDDWISLVRYKALEVDFLEKIQIFWKRHGPHVTSQIIYMGLLESLFGLNYKIFALINITFKILATISLYPLILLLFKRKLLAFLAVVLYSLSYSTVGTFHDVHKGTEYQAIFFMNIFLIIYILLTRKQTLSLKWLLALIITFATAILLAPPRLFPLTLLPLIIELFLWLHNRTKYNLRFGLKKLFFLYLPFILLFIYHPSAIIGRFIIPITHLQKILKGYWFTILNPLSGLGYMILWDSYWIRLIGSLNIDSFKNYLLSLFSQTTFVFGLISIFLALIFTKNKMHFIVLAFILNFILGILIFFLATNHLKIPPEQRVNFDFNILYSVFVGAFVFVLSIYFYVEWLLTGKKNGKKGFLWQGVCVKTPSGIFFLNQEVFYELGNFYAFEIDNNNLTDIRDKVLKDIGI